MIYAIAYLNINELDSNQNSIRWEDNSNSPVTGTTDWTQKTFAITTSATTAYLTVYVEMTHDANSYGGDVYKVIGRHKAKRVTPLTV